jgi:hypothetical protein
MGKAERDLARAWRGLMILGAVAAGLALVCVGATTYYLSDGRRRCRVVDSAAGAAVAVPPPAKKYPCQYESGMCQAYMEDASDKGGVVAYDPTEIAKLQWFTFDITPNVLPPREPDRCQKTLAMLAHHVAVHPDVTGTAVLGTTAIGSTTPAAWAQNMKSYLDTKCPGLTAKVEMVLLEPESMDPTYGGKGTHVVNGLNWLYKNDYQSLQAAFKASFPNLMDNGISQYATDPLDLTHTAYPNVVLEAYNLWSGGECVPFGPSRGCKVDFNTTASGGLKYPSGALCGPPTPESAGYPCPALGCPPGSGACITHPKEKPGWKCDAAVAYGGGVYDPLLPTTDAPWTPYQRGGFFGTILADYLASHVRPVPEMRFIMFPFTDASCPSLYGAIRTADEFDRFVQGCKDSMAQPTGPFTYETMNSFIYGAWGLPRWLQLDPK